MKNEYGLTPKELKFCEYYLQMCNATQAAIKAGYPEKNARFTASRMLTKNHIRAYVDRRLKDQENELVADTNEVLRFFSKMMRNEIEEEQVVVVLNGKKTSSPVVVTKKASARECNVAASNLLSYYTKVNLPSSRNKEVQEWDETIDVHRTTLEALKNDRTVEGFDNGESDSN